MKKVDSLVPPLLLTIEQASECLGVGKNTIYKLVYSGQLKSIKLGRHFRRIPRKALEEWIEQEAREGF